MRRCITGTMHAVDGVDIPLPLSFAPLCEQLQLDPRAHDCDVMTMEIDAIGLPL